MKKGKKIWIGREMEGVKVETARSLKGICEKVGVNYWTARRNQDIEGGKTRYLVGGDRIAWEVWLGEVGL